MAKCPLPTTQPPPITNSASYPPPQRGPQQVSEAPLVICVPCVAIYASWNSPMPVARPACSTAISNYRRHSPSHGAALITESGRRSQKHTLLCVAAVISPRAQGDGLQCRFGSVTAHLSHHLKNWVINDP
ncbi:hypothetical protein JMJ77_0001746 [Colletotrichum scovillei]|uniref:Uncharacterized protein n=1 Tax=Colletotrichum scovillei TaxID=1209932 RepID=A0A9P7R9Y4_9PEZI|nr:hypothetical protein JMJ77_0001746 [Colletotrichum scovillei]KAG7070154.1 hypothetical protein JMJ76_0001411 [Colletotrichum scovillei]KAG7078404.1 hypothetical protein JMJ78_0002076 [Colletotrichum scovillei]